MAKTFQFDDFDGRKAATPHCIACEEMLADALDESLGESDQAWFDRHVSTCIDCNGMYADAQRGAAWLELLKTPRPEPSAKLMERILSQTSGQAGFAATGETVLQPRMVPAAVPIVMPVAVPANLLQFRPRTPKFTAWPNVMLQPRLAMTAAMAFFSIALTLNLTGVQLNRLHLSDLTPTNLKHTYYAANADAARYYDNLRVVRVMESRVQDLREAAEEDSAKPAAQQNQAAPEAQPHVAPEATPDSAKPKPEEKKPEAGPGVSRRESPVAQPVVVATEEEIDRSRRSVATMQQMHQEGGLV